MRANIVNKRAIASFSRISHWKWVVISNTPFKTVCIDSGSRHRFLFSWLFGGTQLSLRHGLYSALMEKTRRTKKKKRCEWACFQQTLQRRNCRDMNSERNWFVASSSPSRANWEREKRHILSLFLPPTKRVRKDVSSDERKARNIPLGFYWHMGMYVCMGVYPDSFRKEKHKEDCW